MYEEEREQEVIKWKHEKAVPYKREQLCWRKLVEQEELEDEQDGE